MPVALAKVQKKIRKKKGGALNNLGDRDVKRVTSAALRQDKLKRQTALRSTARTEQTVRTVFFKVESKNATEPFTEDQVRELCAKWVCRNDTELAEYIRQRRPGRPPNPKQQLLEIAVEKEKEEFRTGFLVPDLMDWANLERLQKWDGSVGGLAQVNFTRVTKDPLPRKEAGEAMEE